MEVTRMAGMSGMGGHDRFASAQTVWKPEGEEMAPGEAPELAFLAPRFAAEAGFPWIQVWGFAGSLLLTVGALWLVTRRLLAPNLLLAVILLLAVGQAALQLGVFMHLREGRGAAWQLLGLGLAFFIAIGLIGMSIWIMMFKSGVS
jgi:cytochrome aa3-600 menaquinol oxidase subunit 4